jgi:hypothetical protein
VRKLDNDTPILTSCSHHTTITPEPERGRRRSPAPSLRLSPLRSLRLATAPADIVAGPPPVAVFVKTNTRVTDAAPGERNRGRIFQPLDMSLVRTQIHIVLSGKRITAGRARLPRATVALRVVEPTPRQSARVVTTAVSCVGKELVGTSVIVNPRLAALGWGQTDRVCCTDHSIGARARARDDCAWRCAWIFVSVALSCLTHAQRSIPSQTWS